MIASEILHSNEGCQNETVESRYSICENPATLFPILPFGQMSEIALAEEVVWIEGTVTVSF